MYKKIKFSGNWYYLVPVSEIDKPATKDVAFVIGHHKNSQGDFSSYYNSTEFNYMKNFALVQLAELGDVFLHNETVNGYNQRQIEMAERTKDYKLVIELHWNSFDPDGDGEDNAEGAECLVYYINEKMNKVGAYFCKEMNEAMELRNRGCKLITKNERGGGFLHHTKGDAIILEPLFADRFSDVQKFSSIKYLEVIKNVLNFYNEL